MEDPYPTGKYPDSKVWVCALFSCLILTPADGQRYPNIMLKIKNEVYFVPHPSGEAHPQNFEVKKFRSEKLCSLPLLIVPLAGLEVSGPEKGSLGGIVRISKFSRISRKCQTGRILLCFPRSGGSLKSLESVKFSRISRAWTFPKRPLF